jgi:hypothetical protein
MRQFPFLHSLFKKILKPFENIKQKVTSKKKKTNKQKTKKTPTSRQTTFQKSIKPSMGICLKEFLMRMLKVSVVMNKFKSFRDSFLGKIFFLCWNKKTKKPLI